MIKREDGIMLALSLLLMLYGLAGVFASLMLFYIAVKIMTKVFPYRGGENDTSG